MNIHRVDLNLLVYLDVLLRERNVTQAAAQLNLSQPAMSNGLRRLREVFNDPLLVRTSDGMTPTERALELEPLVRDILGKVDMALQPTADFDPTDAVRTFRIMASDVSFLDVERGKVDLVINRFDSMPQSFHQNTIWNDSFSCLLSVDNPLLEDFSLESYLKAQHVWVSKTGMGVGVGVNPEDVQRLGWVDAAIAKLGKKRNIAVFTRHYNAAMILAEQNDLVVTLPTLAAQLQHDNPRLAIKTPPFDIPALELKLAWSPLLQHNPANRWLRQLIVETGREVSWEH